MDKTDELNEQINRWIEARRNWLYDEYVRLLNQAFLHPCTQEAAEALHDIKVIRVELDGLASQYIRSRARAK